MRSLLSLALLTGCVIALMTPDQASAWGRRVYVAPVSYGEPVYYVPNTNAPAYSVNSYAGPVLPYYTPAYSVYPAAYSPGYSSYYGPRYDRSFRAWAPTGNLYNP